MRITRSLKYRPDQSLFADGSASAPGISFASDSNTGFYEIFSGFIGYSSDGVARLALTSGVQFKSDSTLEWSSGVVGGTSDVVLVRDAANTLAQRNGTNAQAFRIYNSYTDASNYERLKIYWAGNQAAIRTEAAGTGTVRNFLFGVNGEQWGVNTSGNFISMADNTYDIGASGANRPRTIYAATGIVTQHMAAATPTGGTSGEVRVGNSKIWVNDAGTWKSVAVA
jgi:hypothetical protein